MESNKNLETNNKITSINTLAIICLLVLVGCTIIGVGVGISISQVWASTLVGVGLSFIINAGLVLFHHVSYSTK